MTRSACVLLGVAVEGTLLSVRPHFLVLAQPLTNYIHHLCQIILCLQTEKAETEAKCKDIHTLMTCFQLYSI